MPIIVEVPIIPATVPGAPALSVTLPGGLVVGGVTDRIGADALSQARALIAAANAALAPLGPVFAIIDAILAIKHFADAVPGVVLSPADVVDALVDVARKASRLLSLVPQLSVPLMLLGIVDVVIAVLEALAAELLNIAAQEARIESSRALAATFPVAAAVEALVAVADAASDQVDVQRADVASALAHIEPMVEIINTFSGIVGLPQIELSVDATSGGTTEAAESMLAAAETLRTLRSTIPV